MSISLATLAMIMPAAGARCVKFLGPLNEAMAEFEINTPARQQSFLAQIAHESNQLASVAENLNYTPKAILATFNGERQRFTPEQAERYGRTSAHPADQQMIANIAYANRMGNGGPETGDGWRHRGAGLIQLTGKDNQFACALALDIDLNIIGEWLRTPVGACRSAGWFWKTSKLNALADLGDQIKITRRINGGTNGLADRLAFYEVARKVII